jgi:hypothetical protein
LNFFSYEDFYNIFPVGHGVDEEKIKAYYESLWEDTENTSRRSMDYRDLCRLMDLVFEHREDT